MSLKQKGKADLLADFQHFILSQGLETHWPNDITQGDDSFIVDFKDFLLNNGGR
jgi:hypothetical protein